MSIERIHGPDFKHDNTQQPLNVEDQISDLVELEVPTPTVDKMLNSFRTQWQRTIVASLARAEALEDVARDLRERCEKLAHALDLTDEVKGAVLFEIELRRRADSLALVNPK